MGDLTGIDFIRVEALNPLNMVVNESRRLPAVVLVSLFYMIVFYCFRIVHDSFDCQLKI